MPLSSISSLSLLSKVFSYVSHFFFIVFTFLKPFFLSLPLFLGVKKVIVFWLNIKYFNSLNKRHCFCLSKICNVFSLTFHSSVRCSLTLRHEIPLILYQARTVVIKAVSKTINPTGNKSNTSQLTVR